MAHTPMPRRLLNLLAALSLLAFVAIVAMWLRSHSRFDVRYVERNNIRWRLRSDSGQVSYVVAGNPRATWQTVRLSGPLPQDGNPGGVDERRLAFSFLGFRAGTGAPQGSGLLRFTPSPLYSGERAERAAVRGQRKQ